MSEAIDILMSEVYKIKDHIRLARRMSDEVQADLVKGWPERDAELLQAVTRLQENKESAPSASTNIAIMPCSCRHEIILGQDVIIVDKQCGVHGSTAQ